MKAALMIILLVSICLLHAGADDTVIPVHPDFDAQSLAGLWYPSAVVFRNLEPADFIGIDAVVEPSDGGDLVIKTRYIQDETCQEPTFLLEHTEEPGVFKVADTREIIHMVDVDYESYYIVHIEMSSRYTLYLLSRTEEASDDVKTKFRTLAETLGFDVDQIIYISLAASCP